MVRKTIRKKRRAKRLSRKYGGALTDDDTEIFVEADRIKWTNSVKNLKPFFVDIIADCFKDPFQIESKTIPMLLDTLSGRTGEETTTEQDLTYSGSLQLTWSLIGGIVYEYIYGVDTAKKNAPFTPTCDIDLPVSIPDVFFKESDDDDDDEDADSDILRINFDKVLDSTLFRDLVDQIIARLKKIDFSHIDTFLDELPPYEDEEYEIHDHGKIRIISAEGGKQGDMMVSKKIQLFIKIDGQYGEIADIMMKLRDNESKINSSTCVVKKGHADGIQRNIFFTPLEGLLVSEIDALLNRFQLGNVKTENHIGRIRYILNSVVASGDTFQQQGVLIDTIRMLTHVRMAIGGEINTKLYAKIAKKVLCKYKGKDITIKDIIYPIAPYGVEKRNEWYMAVFPELL